MAKLVQKCPVCGKQAKEISHSIDDFLGMRFVSYACGHDDILPIEQKKVWEELISRKGHTPYQYQGEGYEFVVNSNFRALIADEPGLGKTIQALITLKLHKDTLCPALITVKSSLIMQWFKQLMDWCGPEFMPQLITSSKERPDTSNFDIVIVTYDVLARIRKAEKDIPEKAEKAIREKLGLSAWDAIPEEYLSKIPEYKNPFLEAGFKTIILDECQQIKNEGSQRTQAVQEIAGKIPHVIALSGTPIKNNGGEYFPILNILDPGNFHTKKRYVENYCDYVLTPYGYKIGGIRDMELFDSITKDYIIRRTRQDVLPDLPTLNRKFVHCDFASAKMEQDYKDAQEDFEDFFYKNEGKADFYSNILEKINKLRHMAGRNKVPFAAEYILDFILDTNRKIVIFTHHHDVMETLRLKLIQLLNEERKAAPTFQVNDPLTYEAAFNMKRRNEVIEQFEKDPNNRILIASGLAAGEGLNLQFVSDCIILERQWNPANEEQQEGRFIRIGATCRNCGAAQDSGEQEKPICTACGFELKVDAHYILSSGTIDEYFTELVEYKRSIMGQVLDKKDTSKWQEEGLLKELALILAQKGSKRWRL